MGFRGEEFNFNGNPDDEDEEGPYGRGQDFIMDAEYFSYLQNRFHDEMNLSLLRLAHDIAKSSWFWKFRSAKSRMLIFTKIYKTISSAFIIDENFEEMRNDVID